MDDNYVDCNFVCRIDDIEDGSELRRGVPAAHLVYGVGRTINCANYAYFVALNQVKCLNHPKVKKANYNNLLVRGRVGRFLSLGVFNERMCQVGTGCVPASNSGIASRSRNGASLAGNFSLPN